MVITYFGEGCFRLVSGERSLLVDPTSSRLKADVTLKTLTATNVIPALDEIVFPGEYEMKGIEIRGFPVEGESTEKFLKTVYAVSWEEMRFVFLGHLSKLPHADLQEELGEPDLLVLPVGGGHFLSPAEATKLVKQLEPAVAIPSFYKTPHEFLKAVGQKAETSEKFVFKKKDLGSGTGRVVVLKSEH